jgi:hypothetical protein
MAPDRTHVIRIFLSITPPLHSACKQLDVPEVVIRAGQTNVDSIQFDAKEQNLTDTLCLVSNPLDGKKIANSPPACHTPVMCAVKDEGAWRQPRGPVHERHAVQRLVHLHRQLGPLDPRRGDPRTGGRGAFPLLFGRQPAAWRDQPHAIALLEALGYDVSGFRSKSWEEFAVPGAPEMDFIFTVCDDAAGEACPVWPGHPATAHWGVPDRRRSAVCLPRFRLLSTRPIACWRTGSIFSSTCRS